MILSGQFTLTSSLVWTYKGIRPDKSESMWTVVHDYTSTTVQDVKNCILE
jgi:hypothetical protein